jgi:hypothetical protein
LFGNSFEDREAMISDLTLGVDVFLTSLTSACVDERLEAFAGSEVAVEDMGGGGRRPVRRLTAILIMVPYVPASSNGS